LGYSGTLPTTGALTNDYFKLLLDNEWEAADNEGVVQYKAKGGDKELYITPTDYLIKNEAEFNGVAQVSW